MTVADWKRTYVHYTAEELDKEIKELKKMTAPITSQGVGSKNHAKDHRAVQVQLTAALEVKNGTSRRATTKGTVDMGSVDPDSFGVGEDCGGW